MKPSEHPHYYARDVHVGDVPDCPYCRKGDGPHAVHPETVFALCSKHRKMFKKWHDEQVKKGNIKPWTNGDSII